MAKHRGVPAHRWNVQPLRELTGEIRPPTCPDCGYDKPPVPSVVDETVIGWTCQRCGWHPTDATGKRLGDDKEAGERG